MAASRNQADDAVSAPPQNLLIVQGTTYCNIDCKYCHLPDRNHRKRMPVSTFGKIIERVVDEAVFADNMTVVWRAGEPLTLPIEFYKDCVAITDRYAHRIEIRHAVQTNGMLITPAWCEFFRERDISVGLSMDGPPSVHDRNRTDRCGSGTFRYAARGLRMLEAFDIPFSITCVLTYQHLDRAKEIFDFLADTSARQIIFNIDEIKGANTNSSFQAATDGAARYRTFIKELLSLNEQRGFPLVLSNLALDLLESPAASVNPEATPWNVVSVDIAGNVSTFSPELMGAKSAEYNNFVLGNLLHDSFAEIIEGRPYRMLAEEIRSGVDLCRAQCEYFAWCGGGAPANKFFEHGSFAVTETMFCRLTKKAVCEANLEVLEEELAATNALR